MSVAGYTQERQLVDLVRGAYYESVVGNALGDASRTPTAYAATTSADYALCYVYVLGWGTPDSATPTTDVTLWTNWTGALPGPNVQATLFRHANYDYCHRATVYQDGMSQSIPPSLYYTAKPSYFGSLQWPPIGPDVSGLVTNIPAQARWAAYLSSGRLDDLFND